MFPNAIDGICFINIYDKVVYNVMQTVGLKRPYPFSLDNPPGHSFPCKFPPTYVPTVSKSDESASCGNGGTLSLEPNNPIFR